MSSKTAIIVYYTLVIAQCWKKPSKLVRLAPADKRVCVLWILRWGIHTNSIAIHPASKVELLCWNGYCGQRILKIWFRRRYIVQTSLEILVACIHHPQLFISNQMQVCYSLLSFLLSNIVILFTLNSKFLPIWRLLHTDPV